MSFCFALLSNLIFDDLLGVTLNAYLGDFHNRFTDYKEQRGTHYTISIAEIFISYSWIVNAVTETRFLKLTKFINLAVFNSDGCSVNSNFSYARVKRHSSDHRIVST